MLFRNPDLPGALEFIRNANADVFCLQEVPERFLSELEALPFHLAFGTDMTKIFPSGAVRAYNVILSRFPIEKHGKVPYANYWPALPFRTKAFVQLMRAFSFSEVRDRNAVYADVRTPAGLVRIFDLHLSLSYPRARVEEFERAMLEREPSLPTIVCGDFNVLESPHITPLNWLLGGTVLDTLRFGRERARMEGQFARHELRNALRGRPTHPLSRSQLDHILHSRHFRANHAQVLADSHGSDHLPVRAELDYI